VNKINFHAAALGLKLRTIQVTISGSRITESKSVFMQRRGIQNKALYAIAPYPNTCPTA
jgi:hypothetical protein